jgi:O-antigen ligase
MSVFDIAKSRSAPQTGAALALGIVLGLAALVLGPTLVLGGILGLTVLIATFTNPEVVIPVVLCFALGIIPLRFNPRVQLPFAHFRVSDLLLIWLFVIVVCRLLTDKSFHYVKTPLDKPLLLFYGAVVIGMATAVSRSGINFSDTTYEARLLMYYLIFFAVTNLVRTKLQLLRLVRGVFFIALVVAGTMIIQVGLGRKVLLMDESILRGSQGLIRFYHPGILAVYAVLLALICHLALRKDHHLPWLGALVAMVLGAVLLLGVSRNLIITGTVSIGALVFALRPFKWSRLVGALVLMSGMVIGVAGVLGIIGQESWLLEYPATFFGRIIPMFSRSILSSEDTLLYRLLEVQYAWARITEYPILGIGLWTPYRPTFWEGDPLVYFIHNAYVSIWLKTGLLGLVSFLWLCASFLRRGFQHWREVQSDLLRAVTLGFTVAYLGLTFSNLVAPTFVQDWMVALFGIMMGINELAFAYNTAPES